MSVTAFAEGLALVEKAGVDRAAVVDAALKSVIASPVLGYRAPLLVDDTNVYADVELQQKDLVLAQGWVDMRVQFLIDSRRGGSDDLVVGKTVLPPGARHERHLHHHADEFLVVLSGSGEIYTDGDREPSTAGDVIFTPRGHWHGFDNTGLQDVVLIWGWSGAGSLSRAGYAVPEENGHQA